MITLETQANGVGRGRLVLMSIKPCYWERIRDGSKHFELRKTSVRFSAGDLVVVYASSPFKALVGAFEVAHVLRRHKDEIWADFGPQLGITAEDYFQYFSGSELATAIKIRQAVPLRSISLHRLQATWPQFRPPQSFMYWGEEHLRQLALTVPLGASA